MLPHRRQKEEAASNALQSCHTTLHFLGFVCAPHRDMLVCCLNIYVSCLNTLQNNKQVSASGCKVSALLLEKLNNCWHFTFMVMNARSSSCTRGLVDIDPLLVSGIKINGHLLVSHLPQLPYLP